MDTYDRSMIGRRSKAAGDYFEEIVNAACRFYEENGIAVIEKTPEPMKILQPYDRRRGQFICCFAKQAQPDFKGVLMDSTMVVFDAKHTEKDRIIRDAVTEEQEKCFERYMKMEAICFLVISIELKKFYRVPWPEFRDMKTKYGHKYMNLKELEPYEISYRNGVLRLLDGLELRERRKDESKKE